MIPLFTWPRSRPVFVGGTGKMPFWGGAIGGVPPFMVMQEILGSDILFDGPEWEGISEEAIDFVHKLLDRDYNSRMTAEQVLTPHNLSLTPWRCTCGTIAPRLLD